MTAKRLTSSSIIATCGSRWWHEDWPWAALLGAGMLVAGALAWLVAIVRVVLPYDETFLGLSRAHMEQANRHLLSFMTHDRVTLAGIMISIGVLYGGLALGADRVHQPAPHGRIQPPQWPRGTIVVVHFPAPGVYPYEVDYDECCGGQLVLTMASGTNNGHVVPPTGSRALSPSGVGAQPIGHARTFTVAAQDGSGAPLANHPIVLVVSGAGYQQLRGTTDAAGVATFTYTGTIAGTDNVQAIASASGLPSYSNVIAVPWTSSSGLGSGSAYPQAEPGWIASPADFSQVSGRGSQS